MTKLAIYERGEGKHDINMSHYFRTDYIRFQILKSILSVTVGYLLILALIGLYRMEYFINEATKIDYKEMGQNLLTLYLVILAIYIVFSYFKVRAEYKKARKNLVHYNKQLNDLVEIYKNEKTDNYEG